MSYQFLREPYLHRANTQEYWLATDLFHVWQKSKNNLYSNKDVVYKFNNYGFRCDDFSSAELYPYRIVFTGCSYTEGIGLPLEQTWPKIFHSKLCSELGYQMPYWNLAAAASSTDHILRHQHCYNELLKPQIVVCLLPYLERRERWMGDFFNAIVAETSEIRQVNKSFFKEEYIQYQTEKNLAMFDLLLEKTKTKMFLFSMDKNFNIEMNNFKSIEYIDIDIDFFRNRIDYARDFMHPGFESNTKLADLFFINLKDKIKEIFYANRI